jgi:hypothetical protein
VSPPANAIVMAPATFNKFASGIADTLALSLLCEYLSLEVPIVVAPNVNPRAGAPSRVSDQREEAGGVGVHVLAEPSAPPPTWMVGWERTLVS